MNLLARALAAFYQARIKAQKLGHHLLPRRRWLILDVGSGDGPSPSADVLCDRYPLDDTERTAPLRMDRPFVVGDVEDLPFVDGAFDFAYCSHVLEHTRAPGRAVAELERVARAGYIEVPSEFLEKSARSTSSHLWFVRLEDGKLVFAPKPAGVLDPLLNDVFDRRLMNRNPLYTAFHLAEFYTLFNIRLLWQGSIPHEVRGGPTAVPESFAKALDECLSAERLECLRERVRRVVEESRARAPSPSPWRGWVKRLLRRYYAGGKTFNVFDLLACPACKRAVILSEGRHRLACLSCRLWYPCVEGVPFLTREAAQREAKVAGRPDSLAGRRRSEIPTAAAVGVVIVSYNSRAHLERCVESILRSEAPFAIETVVVDNASSDGTPDMVRSRFAGVRLLANPENRGYGAACNQGIHALDTEFVLLLNSDTVVFPDTVRRLVQVLRRRPAAGAVTPQFFDEQGDIIQMSWGWEPLFWGEFLQKFFAPKSLARSPLRRGLVRRLQGRERQAQILYGAAMLFRKRCLEAIGGMDEDYVFYLEDSDICRRARDKGWELVYTPEARIVHHLGKSSADDPGKMQLLYRQSQLLYYRKHGSVLDRVLLMTYLRLKFWRIWMYRLSAGKDPTAEFFRDLDKVLRGEIRVTL